MAAYFEQAQREGIDSPAVEKAIALLGSSIAAAEAQGRAAVDSVLHRVQSEYGSAAAETVGQLFSLMQTR